MGASDGFVVAGGDGDPLTAHVGDDGIAWTESERQAERHDQDLVDVAEDLRPVADDDD